LAHDQKLGLWFHPEVAACIASDLEELHADRRRISLLEETLAVEHERIVAYEQAIDHYDESMTAQAVALSLSEQRNRALQREARRKKRGGLLWGIAGGVLMGVLATSLAFGFSGG